MFLEDRFLLFVFVLYSGFFLLIGFFASKYFNGNVGCIASRLGRRC
jgi:hypothetical protein